MDGALQILGQVPGGLIEHQHHVSSRADVPAEVFEIQAHQPRVHGRHQPGQRVAAERVGRAVRIDPVVLGLFEPRRPRTPPGPDAGQRAFLPEAGFVLEPDFDRLVGMLVPDFLDKRGASFSHACIAAGSFLRCWGRGRRYE